MLHIAAWYACAGLVAGVTLALQAIADPRIRHVVLVTASRVMTTAASRQNFERPMRELAALGKSVVVVVDNPTVIAEHDSPRTCGRNITVPWLTELAKGRRCSLRYTQHLASTADYLAWIRQATAAVPGVVLFDPAPILCDIPQDVCPAVRDGQYLYSYGDHISDAANERIARAMSRALAIRPD